MGVVRFISNLILAIILLALVLLVLFTAFSYAASQKAGTAGLDYEFLVPRIVIVVAPADLGEERFPAVDEIEGSLVEMLMIEEGPAAAEAAP